MSNKQELIKLAIPKDYCIVNIISEIADEGRCIFIYSIAVCKIRESNTIEKYVILVDRPKDPTIVIKSSKKLLTTSIERTNNIVQKVLDIIGKDPIIIMNTERELEFIKIAYEELNLNIDNNIIYGRPILEDIELHTREFIHNAFELLT